MNERVDADALAGRSGGRKSPPRLFRRRYLLPFALVLPIVLYEGLLIVYPIVQGIYGSFTRIELASSAATIWVGWDNYERMFSDPAFWKVIRVNFDNFAL